MLLKSIILHRNFERAINEAKICATHTEPGTLVFVVGPSGGGKSTLQKHLRSELYGSAESWPDNKILLSSVIAANSDKGYFSSKDFFIRLLTSVGDPFRSDASAASIAAMARGANAELQQFLEEPMWRSIRVPMTESRIRRAFECLALAVGLKAVFVDEAQIICRIHLNRDPSDYLESLKILAEQLGIHIYLFGTYQLLEFWNHSSQLNRRSHLINLARYDSEEKDDRQIYFAILKMLGNTQQIDLGLLSKHAKQIMTWTYGVFGEAKKLLEKAIIAARTEGADVVSEVHLTRARPTPAQDARLHHEIEMGEAMVRGESYAGTRSSKPVVSKKNAGRRPGRRNPCRDACGTTV